MTVLISGLINLETTLRIDAFPLAYFPVTYPFHGVNSTVSGVGYNLARALTTLGDSVRFLSLIGEDLPGRMVQDVLARAGIPADGVLPALERTPQSVILYEGSGRRQIHVDLKDIQERTYPEAQVDAALSGCDLAALCNINFSRPMLRKAQRAGVLVATDVHAIDSLDDDYNRDFMATADILFMSHERLPMPPEDWARAIFGRFGPQIVVIGMGGEGALLATRGGGYTSDTFTRFPALHTRPIVNTIGAGDALFSAFVHDYARHRNAVNALRRAMVFASYKIGVAGAADGFLDESSLDSLCQQVLKA